MAQDIDPIDDGKNDRQKSLWTCFFCAKLLPIDKVCIFLGDAQRCEHYLQNEAKNDTEL